MTTNNSHLKPYILNAFCQWCYDNDYTPLITVAHNDKNLLPKNLENKTNIFNLGARAIQRLKFENDGLTFMARFNTIACEISLNYKSILSISCSETSYSLDFGSIMLLSDSKREGEKNNKTKSNDENKIITLGSKQSIREKTGFKLVSGVGLIEKETEEKPINNEQPGIKRGNLRLVQNNESSKEITTEEKINIKKENQQESEEMEMIEIEKEKDENKNQDD